MDREKADSFNVPVYAPTLEEFREAVDADGSFRVTRLELVTGPPPAVDSPDDPAAVGRTMAKNVRSVLGVLVGERKGAPRRFWKGCGPRMSCAHFRSRDVRWILDPINWWVNHGQSIPILAKLLSINCLTSRPHLLAFKELEEHIYLDPQHENNFVSGTDTFLLVYWIMLSLISLPGKKIHLS